MAQINLNGRKTRRRNARAGRMNLRVDFTPMVDMNMLLITFFMFCTTLGIPQVMDIVLPTKEKGDNQASHNRTITFLLGENDKVYYYAGFPDYEDYVSLIETEYTATGLRDVLLERNSELVAKSIELKRKRKNKEISDKVFKVEMENLKKSKDGVIAIIKPTDKSSYKNLVDILDEMQVCNVSQYAIVEPEESDRSFIENYKLKRGLVAKL